ncbi:MAG: polysaccharide export protein [Candidatus Andeanibacterium colombiense]|uniref:Polysaccharide export protein n=1 Tax=Candidatus Andeanibacterium colombiense TaxID=3121345 RepID=A0AAJ5X681_9SPHN|nr:MAG: polysaccharide export protein [Sphingomonadaceae bacterium]
MKKVRQSRLVAVLPLVALAACQPQLHPNLPVGDAAYATLDPALPPPGSSYLLSPGDVVTVNVFQEPDLTVENVAIDGAGNLYLPLIGQVQAGGRTQAEVSQDIQRAYAGGYLRNPQVAVVVKQSTSNILSVEGEVVRPGVYPIQPGSTLLTAMALAGSPTKTAKLDQVLVFRTVNGQRLGARFDLSDIRSGKAGDPLLLPGDVIVVGFSAVRGAYRDILDAAPLFNVFTRF